VKAGRIHDRTRGVAAGLTGTIAAHAAALAVLLYGVRTPTPGPPVYAVELVAAPTPPPQATPAPIKPALKKETVPTVKAPPPSPTPAEPNPRRAQPVQPLEGEKPSTGSDVANVRTPGLEFPFPDYLRNIVQEVYRRWQRPLAPSALRGEVSFMILRDGTVRDIRVTRSSGSFSFDLAAQGAIEAAGTAGAFGPLPDGWSADVLPVTFYFTPRSP
jgi:periplasmic protein TonB